MIAKVIPISRHRRYEHAHLTIYKEWIGRRREADYKSRGWALEPVSLLSANCPSLNSIYYYGDLIEGYRTKLEIDSVTASARGKLLLKPEIFSRDIVRRCKLLDEEISKHFMAKGPVLKKGLDDERD